MLIELGNGVALGSDERSFTLCRKSNRKKKDRSGWEAYAWFLTPEQALREAFRRELLSSEAQSFVDLNEHANRVLARFCHAFAPNFELIDRRKVG